MALYWRSPYKEHSNLSHGSSGGVDTGPTDVQSAHNKSMRSSSSAHTHRSRLSEPVSPQDWFDSSLPTAKKRKPTVFRRAGGSIKGILKSSPERAPQPEEMFYKNTDPVDHSTNDRSDSRKEKKKVTFGSEDSVEVEIESDYQFQPPRSTSANQIRIPFTAPLNEFARQNLKKLLGYAQNASLPPVSGKSIAPRNERPTSSSSNCKHSPDLRCAKCFPDHEKNNGSYPVKYGGNKSYESRPVYLENGEESTPSLPHKDKDNGTPEQDVQKSLSLGHHREPSPTDSDSKQEPRKSLERHWTKSFVKSTERRKRSRHLAGRYPFSAGMIHRQRIASLMLNTEQKNPSPAELSSEFLKLQVTGGGKLVGHKPGDRRTSDDPAFTSDTLEVRTPGSPKSDGSGAAHGLRGYKIPATAIQPPAGSNYPKKPTTPSGLRLKYGVAGVEGREEYYSMDKTAQIMSWLQDVKQKEGFKPRSARFYVLEPQHLH